MSGKIMTMFATSKLKTHKVAKSTKKCVIKRKPKFTNYKNCSEATQLENKTKQPEKTKLMEIFWEKIIKNS